MADRETSAFLSEAPAHALHAAEREVATGEAIAAMEAEIQRDEFSGLMKLVDSMDHDIKAAIDAVDEPGERDRLQAMQREVQNVRSQITGNPRGINKGALGAQLKQLGQAIRSESISATATAAAHEAVVIGEIMEAQRAEMKKTPVMSRAVAHMFGLKPVEHHEVQTQPEHHSSNPVEAVQEWHRNVTATIRTHAKALHSDDYHQRNAAAQSVAVAMFGDHKVVKDVGRETASAGKVMQSTVVGVATGIATGDLGKAGHAVASGTNRLQDNASDMGHALAVRMHLSRLNKEMTPELRKQLGLAPGEKLTYDQFDTMRQNADISFQQMANFDHQSPIKGALGQWMGTRAISYEELKKTVEIVAKTRDLQEGELKRGETANDLRRLLVKNKLTFEQIDQDGDGKISKQERHDAYANLQEAVRKTVDHEAHKQREHAADLMAAHTKIGQKLDKSIGQFSGSDKRRDMFDLDHDGKVEIHEVVEKLKKMGIKDVKDMNHDGKIDAKDVDMLVANAPKGHKTAHEHGKGK